MPSNKIGYLFMLKPVRLTTYQKLKLSEIIYLFLIAIVSPFFVGLEIWGRYDFTFSLIFVNVLQLPAIMLFYRVLLPKTLMDGKIWQFFLLLPVYLIVYEINSRLATLIAMHAPFIPDGYQNLLSQVDPTELNWTFNQSIGYTCLVLLTASSLALIKSLFKQQQQTHEVRLEKVKLELDHLKAQVQPHFFFNTLNNLYALSVQKSDSTPVMIASLSSIMRYVIYDSQHEYIGLEKELDFIKDYVALERLRHTDGQDIQLSIQGDASKHSIPPLLFLPLIENCFKHSLQLGIKENVVKIVIVIDEHEIVFQTFNKKKPKSALRVKEQGGIGLENVKKRLAILYPSHHNLYIEETDDIFELVLSISIPEND